MKTRTIRQVITFNARAHDVYATLMDSGKHSRLTGAVARISPTQGGKFTAYDGDISGTILELVPDQKIVQSWRIESEGWPEATYSRVTFTLSESGGKTRLTFTQSGIPDDSYESLKQGWYDYYWTPMREMLEGK